MRHSWGFLTGGASDVTWRVVWRVLRAPLSWGGSGGFGLRHSPLSLPRGDFTRPAGCAFPIIFAAGALATAGKKLKEGRKALLFFVHRPFLMQASLQRSVWVQKKPSSVA